MFKQISDMIKLLFLNHSLMSIHITHHTYNIALTKNGRCAQIPAFFENVIPRPEEKKVTFTDTHIFDD